MQSIFWIVYNEAKFWILYKHDFLTTIHKMVANWLSMKNSSALFVNLPSDL